MQKRRKRRAAPSGAELAKDFMESLSEHDAAKQSINTLIEDGCNPWILLPMLAEYAMAENLGIQTMEERTNYTKKRLDAVATKARSLAAEIRGLNEQNVAGVGTSFLALMERFGPGHLPNGKQYPAILPEYVRGLPDLLCFFADALQAGWPHPVFREQISDRRAGKEFWLNLAATYTEKTTGREHYPDMANLVELFRKTQGDNKTCDPDVIRNDVVNYRDRNPELTARLRSLSAEEMLAYLQEAMAAARTNQPSTR